MNHIITNILLSIYFICSFFMLSNTAGASSCTWWSDTNCSDPAKIPLCSDGKCTIDEGSKIAGEAVGSGLSKMTIAKYIETVVKYFLSFVTLVAVIYVIYAGFRIMVSAGDEETTKKSRQTIIYVLVGIVIMWLAYWIVQIVLDVFNKV